MSRLPQEVIDDIIDHIHDWDKRTLGPCSLVCSRWSARSRKHLFVQVELSSQEALERWCDHIRPGPSGPSLFVEDLSLLDTCLSMSMHIEPSWFQPSILSKAAPHLQSFSGLRALRIMGWDTVAVPTSLMLHHFGPLPENVTRLTLERMFIRPSALVTFVSHFPRLHYLFISTLMRPGKGDGVSDLHHESHGRTVPTHPRGEFTASKVERFSEPEKVFRGIALLEPRFRRIVVKYLGYDLWRLFWPVVEACAESLEELEIVANSLDADCDGLSLACCPNLRTVKFENYTYHYHPPPSCQFVEKCLSTITSTQLSEVTLEAFGHKSEHGPPDTESSSCDSLDIILYNLAGQYRPRHEGDKLLVNYESKNLRDTGNFLWRFRERGILRHKEY